MPLLLSVPNTSVLFGFNLFSQIAGSSAASPFEITCGVSSIAGTIWITLSMGSDTTESEYINIYVSRNFIFF